jgi:hypothetical protein
MLDLLTPTDHAGAYEWAAVFLAHAALGLALVAAMAAALEAYAGEWIDDLGWLAWSLVLLAYGGIWEGWAQMLGAGLMDAAVDTFAVAVGGALGVLAWQRRAVAMAAVMGLAAAVVAIGVRARR